MIEWVAINSHESNPFSSQTVFGKFKIPNSICQMAFLWGNIKFSRGCWPEKLDMAVKKYDR